MKMLIRLGLFLLIAGIVDALSKPNGVCLQGGDCDCVGCLFECNSTASCINSTISCNGCDVFCSEGGCVGAQVNCVGSNCNMDCGESSCKESNISVTSDSASTFTVRCSGRYSCEKSAFTSKQTNSSSLSLQCTGSDSCKEASYSCYDNATYLSGQCSLNCTETASCASINVDCGSNCDVSCSKIASCTKSKILCPMQSGDQSTDRCSVNCDGFKSCSGADFAGTLALSCGVKACDSDDEQLAESGSCRDPPQVSPPAVLECVLPIATGQSCIQRCIEGIPAIQYIQCEGGNVFSDDFENCTIPTITETIERVPPTSEPVGESEKPPREFEDPRQIEQEEVITAVTIGVANAGGGGGPIVANVGKLAVLRTFTCTVDDVDLDEGKPLDIEFHPTNVVVGGNAQRYLIGAMVMNPVLVIGLLLLAYFFAFIYKRLFPKKSWERAYGFSRFPGIGFLATLFLMQGTSLVSARLAFHPRSHAGYTTIGVVGLVGCASVPIVVYLYVLRRIDAVQIVDPRTGDSSVTDSTNIKPLSGITLLIYKTFFGTHIWVSTADHHAERYGIIYESYRTGYIWFSCIEMIEMLLLSILSAWIPSNSSTCTGRNVIISIVLSLFPISLLLIRPYESPFDNVWSTVVAGAMSVAVVIMTIDLSKGDDLSETPSFLLLASLYMVMFKVSVDLIAYITDICIGRRKRVRDASRSTSSAVPSNRYESELAEINRFIIKATGISEGGRESITSSSLDTKQHGLLKLHQPLLSVNSADNNLAAPFRGGDGVAQFDSATPTTINLSDIRGKDPCLLTGVKQPTSSIVPSDSDQFLAAPIRGGESCTLTFTPVGILPVPQSPSSTQPAVTSYLMEDDTDTVAL
eukprot:TRINITY_DN11705_c0_g1_i1.p1 TRINITY_DN11705_c0_g1~~TRINITY_DN11705_c0_g1_i1.p1  ORF type:complete len:863 (+),score=151.03 TRINITY_DN11705_c0_g1_i1:43-2631(+)